MTAEQESQVRSCIATEDDLRKRSEFLPPMKAPALHRRWLLAEVDALRDQVAALSQVISRMRQMDGKVSGAR